MKLSFTFLIIGSRNQMASFKTPPPNMNMMTLDMASMDPNMMRSFGQFSDEPDTNYQPKRNLNILKESISKLTNDMNQERMFVANMINSSK